jgi:site-specific DNA-methyltransferase (adenine-specific)
MKDIEELKNKVICGDCLEVMKDIPDKSIDMILCDLPYGTTACKWDSILPQDRLWDEYKRIISDVGSVVLFCSGQFTPYLMASNLEMFKYKYVWVKQNTTNFVHAKNRPMTEHEDILIFSKAPMGHISQLGERRMIYNPQGLTEINKDIKLGNGRFGTVAGKRPSHKEVFKRTHTGYPTDILWQFNEVATNKKLHTSEKPIPLLEYLIKTYTNEGDLVLDNCIGSGTTAIASIRTKRNWIGIEKDEKYCEIANKRILEELKQQPLI